MTDIVRTVKAFKDPHRIFINLVMKLHAVRVNKIIEIFKRLCEACGTIVEAAPDLTNLAFAKKLIVPINEKFRKAMLSLQLKIVYDYRYKKEDYIVLVNTTKFTKELLVCRSMNNEETLIFYHILSHMFQDPVTRGEIKTTTASGIGTEHNLLKPKECNAFVRNLAATGVFTLNESRNSYSLHPRAVLELGNKLMEDYDIPTCFICKEMIPVAFTGYQCDSCERQYHNICILKLLGTHVQVKCPGTKDDLRCKNVFDHNIVKKFHFEAAVVAADMPEVLEGVPLASQAADDEGEEEEEELENKNFMGLGSDDIADEEEDDAKEETANLSRFYGKPVDSRRRSTRSNPVDLVIDEASD